MSIKPHPHNTQYQESECLHDDSESDSEVTYSVELINIVRSKTSEDEKIIKIKDLIIKGADVNFKDANRGNNTSLHYAVEKGEFKLIDFFLREGADVSNRNKKGQSPLELAKQSDKPNKRDIQDLLEAHLQGCVSSPSQDIQEQLIARSKYSSSSFEKFVEFEHCKIQESTKSYVDNTQDKRNLIIGQSETSMYRKREGSAGISGQLYEIKLSMLFLLQGVEDDKINSFHLATNMKEAGDFDDLVFGYKYKEKDGTEKSRVIFLQAKHRDNNKKAISLETLLGENEKGDFLLKKYFSSYLEIRNEFSKTGNSGHPIFSYNFKDVDFIIFTNALFKCGKMEENNVKMRYTGEKNILNLIKENNHYYQLVFGGNKEVNMINTLQYSSDCKKLARDLAECVYSGKVIDMNKPIFQKYHFPLADKLIQKLLNQKKGKFRKDFLDGDDSLSPGDKIFRTVFFEEVQKIKEVQEQSSSDPISDLKGRTINLHEKFERLSEGVSIRHLPSEMVSETDIQEFLYKLKLFAAQPNEKELAETIKQKIGSIYCVGQSDVDTFFSAVEYKIKNWWQVPEAINDYLTKTNTFFQEAARISFRFEVKHPVSLFTGRKQEISDLHNKVQSCSEKITVISQMATISGLGGIGKTELARQYIQDYSKADYDDNIIWINAESEGTLIESFIRLAKDKLGISTKDKENRQKGVESIVAEIYTFFAKRKTLFIFDNAENSKYLSKFLPMRSLPAASNKPYILITSRSREWEKGIEVLDLHELTFEDSVEFVKRGLGIKNSFQDQEIKMLVEKLQRFPLAMQQAVAYIDDQRVTGEYEINDYLKEYEQKKKDLLNSDVFQGIDNDYSKTTFTTWQITIDKIKGNKECGETALKILHSVAYFAPENIERKMFLSATEGDEKQLKSAVRLLVKYSMINGEQKQAVLSIHRLVQEVIRLELKAQNKEKEILRLSLELVNGAYVEEESVNHITSIWSYASEHNQLIGDFYFKSFYGEKATPLHLLIRNGFEMAVINILQLIEEKYSDKLIQVINIPDGSWYGITPLHEAAQNFNMNILKLIVKKGAKVDFVDNGGWNPCILATRHNNWEVAEYLKNRYASITGGNKDIIGRNPLEKAYNEYLLSSKSESSQLNKLEIIKYLIENKKINFKKDDKTGRTPLLDYAKLGDLDVVNYLLEAGANIDDTDNGGTTALHTAAANNRLQVVEYLVEYMQKLNKDINIVDQYGATPLISAGLYYHRDVINFLLGKGARTGFVEDDKTVLGKLHVTFLHLAVTYDDVKMVKLLIEDKGVDINAGRGISSTPLHTAALLNNQKVIDFLVEKGADVNVEVNVANMLMAFDGMKHFSNKSIAERIPMFGVIVKFLGRFSSTPYTICNVLGYENALLKQATKKSWTDTVSSLIPLNIREIARETLTKYEIIHQWITYVNKKKNEISKDDIFQNSRT